MIGAAHPGQAAAQGRRTARRRAAPHEAARHRTPGQRQPPGQDIGRRSRWRDRPDANAQPGRLRGPRRGRRPGRDRRHRVRPARATASRWPAPPGPGSSSTRPPCPRCRARWSWRAAGVETGGAAHNRRFVGPALQVGGDVAAGGRHPRPRPADLRRAARRDRPGPGRRRAPALADAGVEHWVVGRVEAVPEGSRPGVALA